MISKNTICLWYDGTALEAATFYARTFPDSAVGTVLRAPSDFPSGKQGDVLTVQFTVLGLPCLGLNGGPAFQHSEAFSFQVATDDQEETDRLWNATACGTPSSATVARKANAAGARTSGACRGRSRHAPSSRPLPTPTRQLPNGRSTR